MARGFRMGVYVSEASSDTTVVQYNVDTTSIYYEEVSNGYSVLNPTTFTPTKSGWTFVGWRMDGVASSDVLVNKVATGGLLRLYAVFKAAVTVTYYTGNSSTANTTSNYKYYNNNSVSAAKFTLTETTMSGWTSAGWLTSASHSAAIAYQNGVEFTRTSNVTLYSKYTRTLRLTYNANGGTGSQMTPSTATASYVTTIGAQDATFTIKACTYEHEAPFIFSAWNTNSSGTGTTYTAGQTITRSSSADLYAVWSVPQPETFNYTGQVVAYTVYPGIKYRFKVYGAQGGGCSVAGYTGGAGGYAQGDYQTNTTKTLYICVGGAGGDGYAGWGGAGYAGAAGYNCGGAGATYYNGNYARGCSGGGGGASSISTVNGGAATADLIVAGGGGAAACWYSASDEDQNVGYSYSNSNGVRGQGSAGSCGYGYAYHAGGGGYYGGTNRYAGTNYIGGDLTNPTSATGQKSGHGQISIEILD